MPRGSSRYQPATKAQLALPSDFHHQLEFHQQGSGTGLGHANRGRDSSLSKLTRPCLLREPNPTYGSQFGLAVCPLAQGKLVTASRRHSEKFPHIYASTALCRTPPLGSWGSLRDTPGNSRLLVPGPPGPYLPNQVSDRRVLWFGGKPFSLVSNGIRHAPFQHRKVFPCYFSVSDPVVNFQRN